MKKIELPHLPGTVVPEYVKMIADGDLPKHRAVTAAQPKLRSVQEELVCTHKLAIGHRHMQICKSVKLIFQFSFLIEQLSVSSYYRGELNLILPRKCVHLL